MDKQHHFNKHRRFHAQSAASAEDCLKRLLKLDIFGYRNMDWIPEGERLPITHEMIEAFIENRCSDVERELVQSAMEVDPHLKAHIEDMYLVRAETLAFAAVSQPLSSATENRTNVFLRLSRLLVASSLTAVLLLVVILTFRPGAEPQVTRGETPPPITSTPTPPHPSTDRKDIEPKENLPDQASSRFASRREPKPKDVGSKRTQRSLEAKAEKPAGVKAGTGIEAALPPEVVALASAHTASGELTMSGAAGTLIAPLATAVVSPQPSLKWSPFSGAAKYAVRVKDDADLLVASVETSETYWRVSPKLQHGKAYTWSVQVLGEDGSPGDTLDGEHSASFLVLSRDKLRAFESIRRTEKPTGASLVELNIRFGLCDHALDEIRRLLPKADQATQAKLLKLQAIVTKRGQIQKK